MAPELDYIIVAFYYEHWCQIDADHKWCTRTILFWNIQWNVWKIYSENIFQPNSRDGGIPSWVVSISLADEAECLLGLVLPTSDQIWNYIQSKWCEWLPCLGMQVPRTGWGSLRLRPDNRANLGYWVAKRLQRRHTVSGQDVKYYS